MLKNKFKLIVAFIAIIMLLTTFSLATNDTTNTDTNNTASENVTSNDSTDETEDATTDSESTTHEGDLYLYGTDNVMDKTVNGNVYIFGTDVKITGKVYGNLFVFANNVTFEGATINYSIYALGTNTVNFNDSGCTDLYVLSTNFNMSYESFVVRDAKIASSDSITFKGAIGGNLYTTSKTISLGEGEDVAAIYGSLYYSAENELSSLDSIVQGTYEYTAIKTDAPNVVKNIIIDVLSVIAYTVVVFLLLRWLTPKFTEGTASFASIKAIPALFIGLGVLILVPIVSILILFLYITAPISFVALLAYALLLSISSAVVSIAITYTLKEKLKFDKEYMTYIVLILAAIVLWALKQIPYVGGWISFITVILGIGIVVMSLFLKKDNNDDKVIEEVKE